MKNKKILYFFNRKAEHTIAEILSGAQPSDRLYGLIEMRNLGWHVDLCDERITPFEFRCRRFFLWINLKTILKASKYDIWLVKDQFSVIITLLARLMKKKLIYIDSLFHIPSNPLRKFILYVNTMLAPKVITYSMYQVDLWTSVFKLNRSKFYVAPYTIDTIFYSKGMRNVRTELNACAPYLLAIGRDMGRDFTTLINAARKTNVNLKLVTLPYLVPPSTIMNEQLEIFENISYPELLNLYSNAAIVVVPLKKGIVYPSGIRAVLEGMIMGKPVISTSTPILEEYVPMSASALAYFKPEDEDDLIRCILKVMSNIDLQNLLTKNANALVESTFCMEKFANMLDGLLLPQQKGIKF